MVCLINRCDCNTCKGQSEPDPRALNGELVFGGWLCTCACHHKTGKEREDYIKLKKEMGYE